MQLLIGSLSAILISALALKTNSLSRSGAAAAAVLGTIVFGLGGLAWAILLLGFFISSSALSQLFGKRKKKQLAEQFSKGSQRDAMQVLANGGVCGVFVLAHLAFREAAWPWLGFAGTLAAVNADTWATELGVLSRRTPRLITTLKPAQRGTAGAVTLAGTLAGLGGALLIAWLAVVFWPVAVGPASMGQSALVLAVIGSAGLAGSLLDSLLAATSQAIYTCPACRKETEQHPTHSCGSPTTLKRGWPWLSNDWVNTACAAAGGVMALLLGLMLSFSVVESGEKPMNELTISISTPTFAAGQPVPVDLTCDGDNRSPELRWQGIPEGTQSLALIVDDPDAPVGIFTHWVLYNMPPTLEALPAGLSREAQIPGIGTQGTNDFRRTGYDGPCPPRGKAHRYFFKLYALDTMLNLPEGLKAGALEKAMGGHILAEGQLYGTYSRK